MNDTLKDTLADFSLEPTLRLSPNRDDRPAGARPALVVLHYTAMIDAEAALERLCDPAAKVSAHYLIGRDGALWGLVPERARAWHAGVSFWGGRERINDVSIGVELDHPGCGEGLPEAPAIAVAPPFAEAQMARLEALLAAILRRWRLPPQAVVGHSDIAPGRKIDPGASFDWRRLARQGLAVAPSAPPRPTDPSPGDVPAFRRAARRFGYGDWPDEALLDAVRRRFPPAAAPGKSDLDASLSKSDVDNLEAMAEVWPAPEL